MVLLYEMDWLFFRMLMRIFTLLMLCIFTVTLAAPDADAARHRSRSRKARTTHTGIKDPRYAALILNPQTGEIYHQAHANARRYPASLTKMMTLYLLFEALDKHKVSLDTRMDVSKYAASMPQTNLSLSYGDRIPVETAIKALVVRSANDVAVVVAEELGGDVHHFAEMMTDKARALGMRHTVFKNPNGLPDSNQYTTASDMARLGIALKRDFPRYYPYFATRQFSWSGSTYYTHNRVMLRYAGSDGIKTGYIAASGFNLVTSVTRGGRPLVGVVMGGGSGKWRDDRMIRLLDSSYKIVASRGASRGRTHPENLPLAPDGKRSGTTAQAEDQTDIADASSAEDEGSAEAVAASAEEEAVSAPEAKPTVAARRHNSIDIRIITHDRTKDADDKQAAATPPRAVDSPFVTLSEGAPVNAEVEWGIQVGAFSKKHTAQRAAVQAMHTAKTALAGAGIAIAGADIGDATSIYRARLVHLSESQAKDACEQLIATNMPCFIFKAGK